MTSRIRLPHNDLAAHARWLAETIVAPFTVPTRLPLLTKPPAPEPEPPQPTLFDLLAALRPREPEAVPVAEDGECPACAEPGIWRLLKGVVAPPSPLALKRQRLKVEREEARAAAAKVEPEAAGRPSPEDVAYVQAAILDILPKGWPSYAKEVISIQKARGVRICRLRLFDDEIGILQLSGQPGAHGYAWKVGEVDKRPFHFDEEAWAWVRVDADNAGE